jgi:hypothetical protein
MKRYSAKLFFQHRFDLGDGKSDIMRRCEERLIVLSARNGKSALRKAKAHDGTCLNTSSATVIVLE